MEQKTSLPRSDALEIAYMIVDLNQVINRLPYPYSKDLRKLLNNIRVMNSQLSVLECQYRSGKRISIEQQIDNKKAEIFETKKVLDKLIMVAKLKS